MLCSDLAEGADRGAYLFCRFQRAVRESTDELQGASVRSEAYWLRLQAEHRLNVHRKRDCDAFPKVVAVARRRVEQMDGFMSHLIDCSGPIALAVSAQLGERAVKFGRVAYMGHIV